MEKTAQQEFEELLKIEEKIAILSEAKEVLRKSICDKLPDEWLIVWTKKINRISKKKFTLKEWVLESDIMINYPECTTVKLDMKKLVKTKSAHDFLAMTVSSYVMITDLSEKADDDGSD